MRKILAVGALGVAAAIVPVTGAQATTTSAVYRGSYTVGADCAGAGQGIVNSSPKAWGYECRPNPLGGYDLYILYP
ncbi:hypothetical protein GCM10009630_27970 [Kribbella jejuensis]|uniref:Secreted protein n=1 Tax=Kribbella jejuensis TaxID=236068 RepID=A0A542EPN7_9ACTN|nr:hypothetical protein [Kribbella jejuensis]TQJ17303.1 hypothetical protein FB475_1418 [Kribbella jejuensis]